MITDDPNGIVGRSEDDRLELKQVGALKTPSTIARAVVAFLNANGGDVWIGYEEANDVATARQLIPNVERERSALQNHLIDTIEPPLRMPDEVELTEENGQIRVSVKSGGRGPYAQRDRGRHFWMRVGNRLRDMSREEIASAFAVKPGNDHLREVVERVRSEQEVEAKRRSILWLRLTPSKPLAINFLDDATKKKFSSWFTQGQATGNRPSGWNFVNSYYAATFSSINGAKHADSRSPMSTQVTPAGQVTFSIELESLYWKGNDQDPKDLWPFALIEYPVSIFRLMAQILNEYATSLVDLEVVGGFFLSGVRGWRLRPGSPREPARPWREAKAFPDAVLTIDPGDLVFRAQELADRPDGRALLLVRRIFAAFDFVDDDLPREFDQKEGVLRLG